MAMRQAPLIQHAMIVMSSSVALCIVQRAWIEWGRQRRCKWSASQWSGVGVGVGVVVLVALVFAGRGWIPTKEVHSSDSDTDSVRVRVRVSSGVQLRENGVNMKAMSQECSS